MVLHSCFFICGHSASGLSGGFVARMNRDIKSAIFANRKKCPWGFQIGKKESVFLDKIVFFFKNHLNLTSEYREVDSFSITYMTAVKLSFDCFERM